MAALSIIKGAVKYGPKAVKKIKEGLKSRKKKKEAPKLDDKQIDSLLRRANDHYWKGVEKNLAKKMDDKWFDSVIKEANRRIQAKKAKPKKKMMGGGKVMKYQKGGRVKMDGCVTRGKTRGRMV